MRQQEYEMNELRMLAKHRGAGCYGPGELRVSLPRCRLAKQAGGMKTTTERHFKVVASVCGINEPFIDWYTAENEIAARELWLEDAHRYGLPVSVTKLTVTEVPELPQ